MRYRFCVISLITILLTFVMCPFIKTQSFVYADSIPEGYTQVTTQKQLTDSFLAYCKSRDSEIDGAAEAVASFTYNTLVDITNTLGISINDLQSELYYYQQSNGLFRYYMTSVGVSFYNDIFAYLIQQNDLEVGQSANEQLFSGMYFTDDNNNTCLVYVVNRIGSSGIIKFGTPYNNLTSRYYAKNYEQGVTTNYTLNYQGQSYSFYLKRLNDNNSYINKVNASGNGNTYSIAYDSVNNQDNSKDGNIAIIYSNYHSSLYLGCVYREYNGNNTFVWYSESFYVLPSAELPTTDINFVSQNISNYYEGDTIINNEGDIITDGGGGESGGGESGGGESGGGESGGDTNIDIDFPDFNFPNIPNIDFNLGDLSHKFPFSIPFDLVAFFTVLNADPVAPSIDRTIPLPDPIADWHFEADFSQFDNYAVIIRNVEYIGFVIGLIYLTVRFVKG